MGHAIPALFGNTDTALLGEGSTEEGRIDREDGRYWKPISTSVIIDKVIGSQFLVQLRVLLFYSYLVLWLLSHPTSNRNEEINCSSLSYLPHRKAHV